MNKNELILDRVRSLTYHDLSTNQMLFRLTSLEDPSLQCTAEGEEVADAIGSVITTLYRAKKATFSATNSLISLDLAAAQYGTTKEIASATNKIIDYTYEILEANAGTITLKYTPVGAVKYIYAIANGEIGTAYPVAVAADATHFAINDNVITVPTGATGKFYVEYTYETEDAIAVKNLSSNFPDAGSVIIYAYFRDKCNENTIYSGKIICPKAKLNPESVELALTSTGKHSFEFNMMKDYCAEEGEDELFTIIVANEQAPQTPSIHLSETAINIVGTGTKTLTVTKVPSNATVTWISSDADVCTVTDAGVVAGVAAGNAAVMAVITVNGVSYTATCSVNVTAS